MTFEERIIELKRQGALLKALHPFVDSILTTKDANLYIESFTVKPILLDRDILSLNKDRYEIHDGLALAHVIFERFKHRFDFIMTNKFGETFTFLCRIEETLKEFKSFANLRKVKPEIWKLGIFESHTWFKIDFQDFISAITHESLSSGYYAFFEAYGELFQDVYVKPEIIYANVNHLDILTQQIQDAHMNYILGKFFQSIKKKCFKDVPFGLSLLTCTTGQEIPNTNILKSVVAGLYDRIGCSFYEEQLEELLTFESCRTGVLYGLWEINAVTDKEAVLFLNLNDRYCSDISAMPILTRLLFVLIKAKELDNKEYYVSECFKRIEKRLGQDAVAKVTLSEMSVSDSVYVTEFGDIVAAIIGQEYFNLEMYVHLISPIFWQIKNVALLRRVLVAIARAVPYKRLPKTLHGVLCDFDAEPFDRMLIGFLIDSKACLRFIALDIINHFSLEIGYRFSYDILQLAPIDQYKLWVSFTQSYKEPKFTIPALIPLLNSNSETVRDSFIWKLEDYAENYGGHVIEAIEKCMEKDNPKHQEVLRRVDQHMRQFYKNNIDVKDGVKELNPFYTQQRFFRDFQQIFAKDFREKLHQGIDKNSFLSTFTSGNEIMLAKGGGWKLSDNKGIAKLGKFGSNFTLPRGYMVDPNKWEMEESAKIFKDWEAKDFESIIKLIDNEQ